MFLRLRHKNNPSSGNTGGSRSHQRSSIVSRQSSGSAGSAASSVRSGGESNRTTTSDRTDPLQLRPSSIVTTTTTTRQNSIGSSNSSCTGNNRNNRSCLKSPSCSSMASSVASSSSSVATKNTTPSVQTTAIEVALFPQPIDQATKKSVRFDNIHIREYARIIGDNPSCSSGAPVGLGWEYGPVQSIPVDAYEIKKMPPRTDKNLILSRQEREEILIAWGASFHDIIEAIRSNVKVKNQRRRTVNAIGTYDRWEEAMEAASRKIKKSLIFTKKQPQSHYQHQQNSQQQAYSEFWYGQSNPPSSSSSNSNNSNNNHHHHHHRRSDILRPPTRTVCHEDDDDVVVAAGDDHNNKQNDSGQHNSQQSLSPPDRKQKVATDTNATTTTSMPKNNINNLKQPEEKEENMVKSDNNNSNHHNLGNVVQVVVDVIPMRPRRRDSKESEPEKQRQIQQAAQQQQQSNHPYMVVDMDKSIASSTLGRDHTEEDNKSQQSGDTFPEGVDAISTLDDEEDSFTTTSYQNNHHHRYNFDEYDVDDDFDALSSLLSESDRYPTEHTFEEIMILESFVESQMHNNNNPHLNSSDRERALLEHAMMIQMNIPPELEDIERDFSHWTIESGHGYPKLQKLIRPVTISEDHPFAEREPSKTTTTTTTTEPSPRTTAQPATALTPPFFNHPSHPDIPSSTLLHAPSFPPLSSSSVGATALVPPDDEYRPNWNGLEIEETPSSTENDPCCWDDFGQRMDGFHAMPPPPNSMNLIAKWS